METDKELLQNAAKAYGIGYDLQWDEAWGCFTNYEGLTFNPLTDDGDALRLAVKLGLNIDTTENFMVGEFAGFGEYEKATDVWFVDPYTAQTFSVIEIHGNDPYAATRMAIVKAAAEIGKTM